MSKRKIININEEKCNGCGLCIPNCPEGALKIIDDKARLISDLFCDGLGACLGHCPQGAITIEEREAEPYDERKVMENIIKAGPNTIKEHLKHLKDHNETEYLNQALAVLREKGIDPGIDLNEKAASPCAGGANFSGGCPGSRMVHRKEESDSPAAPRAAGNLKSELRQWPVQMKLVNPNAPYFKNADLVLAADCAPFAYADFHGKFLKNKALIILCPKLDGDYEGYVDKLAALISVNDLKSITIVNMEVPCCFGIESIVRAALEKAGENVIIKQYTVSISGEII